MTRPPPLRLDERERFEERAAIREYDGGLSRAEAERLALEEVIATRGRQMPKKESGARLPPARRPV